MKTNVIFRGVSGYAMINGVLQNVEFDSVQMTPEGGLLYILGDETLEDVVLYNSKEDFENGNDRRCGGVFLSGDYTYEEKEIDGKMMILTEVWVMEGGKPVMHSKPLLFTHTYITTFEPILGDGMYKSREDCLKFNSYDYKDEEGNIQTKVGIGKKVQLTDEQRKFIDEELVGVLNKAKEMGIMLVLNNSTEYLYAANTKQLKEGAFNIDYSSDIDNDLDWINSDYFYKVPEQVLMMEGEETVYSE